MCIRDRPVASRDPVTAKQVMDDCQRINRDMRITILINIHHVDLALPVSYTHLDVYKRQDPRCSRSRIPCSSIFCSIK